jgi:hypothetical protein
MPTTDLIQRHLSEQRTLRSGGSSYPGRIGRAKEATEENKTKGDRLQAFCADCNRLNSHLKTDS